MGKNIIQEAYVCPTYPQYVIYPVVACYAANAEETNNFSPVTAKIQITEKVDTVETFKAIDLKLAKVNRLIIIQRLERH